MKIFITVCALVCFFLTSSAFTVQEYNAYIDELLNNQNFTDAYEKWAAELFADPEYLYGPKRNEFPCPKPKVITPPRNIHELSPIDITCIGALGDSLTAALGAHAITPLGLLIENRGVSWSVGGDKDYNQHLTVPNAIKEYQSGLKGSSTKFSIIIINGQNASNNGLNVAESGDVADDMPGQANILVERIQKGNICDAQNDWKLLTLFIGGNDLCGFCKPDNEGKYTSDNYVNKINMTLSKLHTSLTRTLVNVVPIFDIRQVEDLNSGGLVCQLFHKMTCPCAAYPTPEQREQLKQMIPEYQTKLADLINSNIYNDRDDFAVVLQPFFTDTILPKKVDTKPEFSLFAPDCFHFSGKGHSYAALSLWNNMLEPVGGKQTFWYYGETLKCPSDTYPYIFTNKNSKKALEEGFNMRDKSASSRGTTPRTTTQKKSTKRTDDHDKHHHKHNEVDSSFSTISYVALLALFVLLFILLVASIVKRQQIRGAIRNIRRSQYTDDDDVEIYSRSDIKVPSGSNSYLPKTHGSRMNFE